MSIVDFFSGDISVDITCKESQTYSLTYQVHFDLPNMSLGW